MAPLPSVLTITVWSDQSGPRSSSGIVASLHLLVETCTEWTFSSVAVGPSSMTLVALPNQHRFERRTRNADFLGHHNVPPVLRVDMIILNEQVLRHGDSYVNAEKSLGYRKKKTYGEIDNEQ